MPMFWCPKNRALEIARDVKALLSGKSRDRQKLERERQERKRERQERNLKRQELKRERQERNLKRQERLSKLHAVRASRDRAERVKLKREKIRQKQAAIGS